MGEIFGHYRLERLLGSGGVGEVWQAEDTNLDRVVALKRLKPSLQADPEALARFKREAKAAARLRHPHIVRVHAIGVIDGRHYLDTELIEGRDLDRLLLTQGPLPIPRVLTIIDQVASALDAAHGLDRAPDKRMVHRDVKPANVLVETRPDGSDHVYLADFGVARALVPGTRITEVGAVVGTPDYMAPELWEGDRSDHRVDVYSLAVMLYQLLTGTLPFERTTLQALIRAHLTVDVPAASAANPGLPAAIDDVLRRGMAKNPDDRFASAPDLAEAARVALSPVLIGGVATTAAAPRTGSPGGTGHNATLALRPPTATRPDSPDRPPPPSPPPAESGVRAYFGSVPHYAGLAVVALLIPLALAGAARLDWTVFPVAALLYGLGAVGAFAMTRRPPTDPPSEG